MRSIYIFILFGLGLVACSGNECYENKSAIPLASFYNSLTLQNVTIQQLEIYGVDAPGDSVLYHRQALKQAYLPLRLWQDSTQFVFAYYRLAAVDTISGEVSDLPTDTVTFRYKPREWFESPACGAMYFYEIKSVSHTDFMIDSISCNDLITNENSTNVKIFFKDVLGS